MIHLKALTISIVTASFISGQAFSNDLAAVKGHALSSAKSAWVDSSGNCVRTAFKQSKLRLEACGDVVAKPAPAIVEKPVVESAVVAKTIDPVTISSDVLFAFDSSVLSEQGQQAIQQRIEEYGNPDNRVSVKVVGHTDSIGTEAYNQGLSERRAESVASYIREHAVSRHITIDVQGRGELEPVASNKTSEGRAKNRRVVVSATIR